MTVSYLEKAILISNKTSLRAKKNDSESVNGNQVDRIWADIESTKNKK